MHNNNIDNFFGTAIYSYTRADAIADGVLTDVSDLAREAGFTWPVAVATNAWTHAIAWPHGDSSQDEPGRLWDVLFLAAHAARAFARTHGRVESTSIAIAFTVHRVAAPDAEPTTLELTLHAGPGDNSEPVFTICALGDN